MQIKETGFEGLIEIIPNIFHDNRGWFYEFYNERTFQQQANIMYSFVQENTSFSKKGVIRGLHFQLPPYAQAKLVTVHHGKVLDVVVDLRRGSKTFGKHHSIILDSKVRNMFMVPEGFAHGFAALEDSVFYYKCTNFYNKSSEGGILWNDPTLKIEWPFENPIVSEKDQQLPTFDEFVRN
jgi:dTDP-4-dehydrorhamnose 3,5-epimerase